MSQPHLDIAENAQFERRTADFVGFIIFTALLFDGYDLVIYGVALPTLLQDPTQIGPLDPAMAGPVGSYALIGVLLGSLLCGAVGDFFGRCRLLARGHREQAETVSRRTGIPLLEEQVVQKVGAAARRTGYAAVFPSSSPSLRSCWASCPSAACCSPTA